MHNLVFHIRNARFGGRRATTAPRDSLHEGVQGVVAGARVARRLRFRVQIRLELHNILNKVDNILAVVVKENLDGLVDKRIVHESAVNGAEMVLKAAGQRNPYVDYFVSSKGKHIMFEIFFEELFSLVHDFFAHDNEQLTALKHCFLTVAEVVLDDFNDGLLLFGILAKLVQDGGESGGGRFGNLLDTVLTEFEEHRQELRVDNTAVK